MSTSSVRPPPKRRRNISSNASPICRNARRNVSRVVASISRIASWSCPCAASRSACWAAIKSCRSLRRACSSTASGFTAPSDLICRRRRADLGGGVGHLTEGLDRGGRLLRGEVVLLPQVGDAVAPLCLRGRLLHLGAVNALHQLRTPFGLGGEAADDDVELLAQAGRASRSAACCAPADASAAAWSVRAVSAATRSSSHRAISLSRVICSPVRASS